MTNRDSARNNHPAVMFEIIAEDQAAMKKFYQAVFGWDTESGSEGFDYVHFGKRDLPLLGGIGQAIKGVPGMEPGHSFYFLVDDLEGTLAKVTAAGGSRHMEPTKADSYRFGMAKDPEGNPFGLVEPFAR